MYIEGVNHLTGNTVSSYNDHRMAMMASIAAIKCEGDIIIDNISCVSKSYPDYFKDYIRLGGHVDEC